MDVYATGLRRAGYISNRNPGQRRLSMEALESRLLLSAAPRNVILMIGDGMGPEQVEAGRYVNAAPLSFESLGQAEMTTAAAGGSLTDSAAAATAMATGRKVNNGVLSMAYPGDGAELTTSLEILRNARKATGLVTTTYVTHATPAAFGAHEPSRANESQIAADYLNQTRPNVLFGGGSHGISLTSASSAGYTVVTNRAGMQATGNSLDGSITDASAQLRLSGQFGTTHLPYEQDGLGSLPHLSEMTATALQVLDNNPDGFFLMVEGGRIDQAGHANDLSRLQGEVVEFSRAVQVVIDWINAHGGWEDTLLIVTADHETGGLNFNSSTGQGTFSTTGHTAVNVPLYAAGAGAAAVTGVLDNTDIFALTTRTDATAPFSLALVPDTQYYAQNGTSHFRDQTQWIVNHLASENIAFVSHVGDIVQNGSNTTEWARADAAMDLLDGNLAAKPNGLVPYSAAAGNHDFDATNDHSSAANYIEHFGPMRYYGRTWYGGFSPDQTSHYQVFSAGGRQFLHLGVEWAPRPGAIADLPKEADREPPA